MYRIIVTLLMTLCISLKAIADVKPQTVNTVAKLAGYYAILIDKQGCSEEVIDKHPNLYLIKAKVRNKSNPYALCPQCKNALIELKTDVAQQVPGCEVNTADERGNFVMLLSSIKKPVEINLTISAKGMQQEQRNLSLNPGINDINLLLTSNEQALACGKARKILKKAQQLLANKQWDEAKKLKKQLQSLACVELNAQLTLLSQQLEEGQKISHFVQDTKKLLKKEGDPMCLGEFGRGAFAIAANADGSFDCRCRTGYRLSTSPSRCIKQTYKDGHKQCRQEFGKGAYAMGINKDGTYQCECKKDYRWKNDKCARFTKSDGHRVCKKKFGPRSKATRYLGNGRWSCTH